MLQWLKRICVEKESGHVVWVDIYIDTETNVEYCGLGNSLTPRYRANGTLYTLLM